MGTQVQGPEGSARLHRDGLSEGVEVRVSMGVLPTLCSACRLSFLLGWLYVGLCDHG